MKIHVSLIKYSFWGMYNLNASSTCKNLYSTGSSFVDFPRQPTGNQGWASTGSTDIFSTHLGLKKRKSTLILSDEDDDNSTYNQRMPPPKSEFKLIVVVCFINSPSGKSTYFSVIPTHKNAQDAHPDFQSGEQKSYRVRKLSVDPEGNWTLGDSDFAMYIAVDYFASGTTKHVYKASIVVNSIIYVAC